MLISITKCLSMQIHENSFRYFGYSLQSRLQNDAGHATKPGLRNGSLGDVRDALHTASGDIGWLVLCNGNTKQGVGVHEAYFSIL
jgi:hypothetical protein